MQEDFTEPHGYDSRQFINNLYSIAKIYLFLRFSTETVCLAVKSIDCIVRCVGLKYTSQGRQAVRKGGNNLLHLALEAAGSWRQGSLRSPPTASPVDHKIRDQATYFSTSLKKSTQ